MLRKLKQQRVGKSNLQHANDDAHTKNCRQTALQKAIFKVPEDKDANLEVHWSHKMPEGGYFLCQSNIVWESNQVILLTHALAV